MKCSRRLRSKFVKKLTSNRVSVLRVAASKNRANLVRHGARNTRDGGYDQNLLCSRERDVENSPLLRKVRGLLGWRKVIVHKRNQTVYAADNNGHAARQPLRFVQAHYPHEVTFGRHFWLSDFRPK